MLILQGLQPVLGPSNWKKPVDCHSQTLFAIDLHYNKFLNFVRLHLILRNGYLEK